MKRLLPPVFVVCLSSFFLSSPSVLAQEKKKPKDVTYLDPAKVDEDYAIQGEYSGTLKGDDGEDKTFGIQIIALGGGEFEAVTSEGGLPGDGWDGEKPRKRTKAKRSDDGSVAQSHSNPVRFRNIWVVDKSDVSSEEKDGQ